MLRACHEEIKEFGLNLLTANNVAIVAQPAEKRLPAKSLSQSAQAAWQLSWQLTIAACGCTGFDSLCRMTYIYSIS